MIYSDLQYLYMFGFNTRFLLPSDPSPSQNPELTAATVANDHLGRSSYGVKCRGKIRCLYFGSGSARGLSVPGHVSLEDDGAYYIYV